MKVKIIRRADCAETEVTVLCPTREDAATARLIAQLQKSAWSLTGTLDGRVYRLYPEALFFIESVDDRSFLCAERAVYECPLKLYELEEALRDTPFVRVSKSVILNTDKLESVRPLLNGKLEARLTNGEKQLVNRHYVPAFREKFGV